ncbi:Outer membrane porin protein [Ralstonia sp. LMG 32965]|uniref:porin n=1 Tax=Ralstonia flatus TaxID=3058601 RepID=UPI0028F6BCE9|nr:porin [Ralstonia sp. LMG 32965]CAJ0863428.1 Outer membrane porin protein [Ralstonia sp. LMG 32965]
MHIRQLPALALCWAGLSVSHYAWAQTSVTLYGLVGLDMASSKRSGGAPATLMQQAPGLTAPYWGIKTVEDLGGGTRAIAVLESFFQPDTGGLGRTSADPFWGRNSYVGLEGHFGKLTFGQHTNLMYLGEQTLNPFQASILFSPLVMQTFIASYGGAIAGDTVWNDGIQYSSPSLNGLKATGAYTLGGRPGAPGVYNAAASLHYTGGALTAVATVQRNRVVTGAPAPSQDAYLVGATYDFAWLKLYGAVQGTRTNAMDSGSHTYEVGASVPLTAQLSLLGEWANTRRVGPRGAATTRDTAAAGLDYAFSKRTDVYAVTLYDRQSGAATAMTYAIGIRHLF